MTSEDTGFTEESSRACGPFLRLSSVCRCRRRLSILFRQATLDRGTHLFHQTFAAHEVFRVNRRMKNDLHPTCPNGESRLRHRVMRTHNRYRNHRNPALHGQIEWTFFEWQKLAVEPPLAFHVDGHVDCLQ